MFNMCDNKNRNTLHYAVMSGNLELVELIMKGTTITMLAKTKRKPVDMHLKDRLWGWTPLHYAAHLGYTDICKALLRRADNLKSETFDLYTPSTAGFLPIQLAEVSMR